MFIPENLKKTGPFGNHTPYTTGSKTYIYMFFSESNSTCFPIKWHSFRHSVFTHLADVPR